MTGQGDRGAAHHAAVGRNTVFPLIYDSRRFWQLVSSFQFVDYFRRSNADAPPVLSPPTDKAVGELSRIIPASQQRFTQVHGLRQVVIHGA